MNAQNSIAAEQYLAFAVEHLAVEHLVILRPEKWRTADLTQD